MRVAKLVNTLACRPASRAANRASCQYARRGGSHQTAWPTPGTAGPQLPAPFAAYLVVEVPDDLAAPAQLLVSLAGDFAGRAFVVANAVALRWKRKSVIGRTCQHFVQRRKRDELARWDWGFVWGNLAANSHLAADLSWLLRPLSSRFWQGSKHAHAVHLGACRSSLQPCPKNGQRCAK